MLLSSCAYAVREPMLGAFYSCLFICLTSLSSSTLWQFKNIMLNLVGQVGGTLPIPLNSVRISEFF